MKILKVFGLIIFIISLCASIDIIAALMGGYESEGYEILFSIIVFGSTICLGYLFRKMLLIPFKAFWNLSFERKMMLLVTIAILITAIFYSWGVWKTKISYHKISPIITLSKSKISKISPIKLKIKKISPIK